MLLLLTFLVALICWKLFKFSFKLFLPLLLAVFFIGLVFKLIFFSVPIVLILLVFYLWKRSNIYLK